MIQRMDSDIFVFQIKRVFASTCVTHLSMLRFVLYISLAEARHDRLSLWFAVVVQQMVQK